MTSSFLQTSLAVDFDDKATDAWFKIMKQVYKPKLYYFHQVFLLKIIVV